MSIIKAVHFAFYVWAVLLVWSSGAVAQTTGVDSVYYVPEAEAVFKAALNDFRKENYEEAAESLMRSIQVYPSNHRITASYLMAGKAYYKIEQYRESIRVLKNLIDLYPNSEFIDDAHYTLGLNYSEMGKYEDAAAAFLKSREATRDPVLRERAEKLLVGMILPALNIGQLQLVLDEAKSPEMLALISTKVAEKMYRSGEIRAALELLQPIARLSSRIKYVADAKILLEKLAKGEVVRIGAVLPLMLKAEHPSMRELGTSILDGIKMAVDEYNEIHDPRVEFDIRDSERDPSQAARIVTDLCGDEKVVAIIGPFFSNEAFAAAGVANALRVPLITPTATSNGIAAIGAHIFQLNPDYAVRGSAMARYAFTNLGARTFAILAPLGGSLASKQMADAFLDEVKMLGGELIDVQWYQPGETDLRNQLMSMRQKGMERLEEAYIDFSKKMTNNNLVSMLRWGISTRTLDSLVEREAKISVNRLFGLRGRRVADSLKIPYERTKMKVDSLGIPIRSIDAIFLPISSAGEIGIISSQLKYFNIQSAFLGTGDWYDVTELDQHRQYADGVIFSSEYYLDEESENYTSFLLRYQQKMHRSPDINALFAYDAMKFILEGVKRGGTNKIAMTEILSDLRRIDGVHSHISLGNTRVNSFLTILQFKNRVIMKIGEIDLFDNRY